MRQRHLLEPKPRKRTYWGYSSSDLRLFGSSLLSDDFSHVSTATLVLAAARHAQRNEPRFPVPQFLSAKGLSARHGRAVWLSKTFSANPGTLCALLSIFSLQFKGTSCSVGAFSRLGKGKQLMTMRDDCLPDDEDCSADPPSQTPASAASTSLPIARAERGRKGVTAVNRVLRAQTMRAS